MSQVNWGVFFTEQTCKITTFCPVVEKMPLWLHYTETYLLGCPIAVQATIFSRQKQRGNPHVSVVASEEQAPI